MAKFLDSDGVLYLWNKIKAKFVAQETGKGLSSNDFTSAEKSKLNSLRNYEHPTYSESSYESMTNGLYKVTLNNLGHVTATLKVSKSDITDLGIPAQDTTYETADSNKDGLMSSTMFNKLNLLPSANDLSSTYAKKSDLTGLYKYKGSCLNESDLPTNASTGDVYNIINASTYGGAGMNVVWTGTAWDALGEVFNIDSITNTELDTICV